MNNTKRRTLLTATVIWATTLLLAGNVWAQTQTWDIGDPTANAVIAMLSEGTMTISGAGAMSNFISV